MTVPPESTVRREYNVLFLCTGNSARSIMAESLLNALGGGRFHGYSAGSHPKGLVHPMALEVLARGGYPIQGLRSKSWDEFGAGGPRIDFVITLCDSAARETCPIFPGRPVSAHWGLADPAAVQGVDAQRRAFEAALALIARRIRHFTSLPFESVDGPVLKLQVGEIGATR